MRWEETDVRIVRLELTAARQGEIAQQAKKRTQASGEAAMATAAVLGRAQRKIRAGAEDARTDAQRIDEALAASPAADLANHVGQVLVVARADRTGQSALEDALTLLSNCPDIKLLLNDAHFSPSGRRFGGYYGYGG